MFKAIIRACQLCLWNYLGLVIFFFAFWCLFLGGIFLSINIFSVDPLILSALAFVPLLIGVALFAIALLIWSLILRILWTKPPAWLNVQWREFGWDCLTSLLATLSLAILFFSKIFIYYNIEKVFLVDLEYRGIAEDIVLNFWWLWLIVATFSMLNRAGKATI
ncbi:MAG: hypothetical protein KME20_13230 [Kaiparowitsia implicata GSE-PSE-MK54-09C]|jgi:hypothetical protein|nr:hypothetical protein [Kaiparowitsia implicata GSE-PSE-MK54-09C]